MPNYQPGKNTRQINLSPGAAHVPPKKSASDRAIDWAAVLLIILFTATLGSFLVMCIAAMVRRTLSGC